MCQWHMFSTDRSGAKKWECVARNNPQVSKSGAFDPDIIVMQKGYLFILFCYNTYVRISLNLYMR